jgi:hypothetical protein
MTSEVITVSLRRADTPLSRRVVVRLEQSLDAEGLWALAKRTLGITSPAPVGVAVTSGVFSLPTSATPHALVVYWRAPMTVYPPLLAQCM